MLGHDPSVERFPGHVYPQVIPTPDATRPGAAAPWAALDVRGRSSIDLARVESRLRAARRHLEEAPPPGAPVELTAAGELASRVRRSAVLVALFERAGETHVVLTRRSLRLRQHRGEIALPGGRAERGESPVATALREAREEVELDPATARPFAWLSPIVALVSNSAIWPIVAALDDTPRLRANPREVDRIFTVALADLAADGAFVEERWRRGAPRPGADEEGFFPVRFFRVPGEVVWGATARVLTELLCVVLDVAVPDDAGAASDVR